MKTEALEALLQPRPIGLLFLLREAGHLGMFLCISLENPRTYEKGCARNRMHKCFRIVDDQAACLNAISQPDDEMSIGWRRSDRWC